MNIKKPVSIMVILCALGTLAAVAQQTQQQQQKELVCKDPVDGKIKITFYGSMIQVTYTGKSAQKFQVFVKFTDGTTSYPVDFEYPAVTTKQTRPLYEQMGKPIQEITNCSFTKVY
ncbi:MAG: hypothetical protein LBD24_02610 [Spirochaetaceae bacterium]|jgi:hypothetical protein|nr:hypothetical protein [Spirochaetaceae bacterium]